MITVDGGGGQAGSGLRRALRRHYQLRVGSGQPADHSGGRRHAPYLPQGKNHRGHGLRRGPASWGFRYTRYCCPTIKSENPINRMLEEPPGRGLFSGFLFLDPFSIVRNFPKLQSEEQRMPPDSPGVLFHYISRILYNRVSITTYKDFYPTRAHRVKHNRSYVSILGMTRREQWAGYSVLTRLYALSMLT